MIILRQKTYATSASFKPKFRKRFRNGDFSYVQAKNPAHEGLNHQAYKEVAAEDEFKNNPETYKIRQGLFSRSYMVRIQESNQRTSSFKNSELDLEREIINILEPKNLKTKPLIWQHTELLPAKMNLKRIERPEKLNLVK